MVEVKMIDYKSVPKLIVIPVGIIFKLGQIMSRLKTKL